VLLGSFESRGGDAFRDRHAGRAQNRLGHILLHGDGGSAHAGMAVRDAEDFEDALQETILARAAMQHDERDVWLQLAEDGSDVAADIDPADAIALPLQRIGARLAGTKRYVALRRPAPQQNSDVLPHASERPK
jgi:hypothetical protein